MACQVVISVFMFVLILPGYHRHCNHCRL